MEIFPKTEYKLAYYPAIPLLGIYLKNIQTLIRKSI